MTYFDLSVVSLCSIERFSNFASTAGGRERRKKGGRDVRTDQGL